MRYLFIITGLLFLLGCSRQTNNRTPTDNHADEVLTKLHGTWTHTEDSLATVEISGSNWTFNYTGTDTESSDKFTITISDTLTRFVDKGVNADFLILSNAKDTMHYEIMTLTTEVMSLVYYPRGNTHVYRRLK